ncbi:hypothetical protein RhiirA4_475747 [Rhizophagus irregularis]|uniref:Uncharacterized protein n=1 Tax=Rhizophagus irregularis TaxID=588596 RepID=A0A2I1HAK6_9GLOM|nr:hypothetical protein RhiirA4_475747 [Rhizophagus irregularis]
MGNNKKKSKKQSSYIPTQEFVDKFTQDLIYTARSVLAGLEYHPTDFTEKVLKPKVPGGDLVKPSSYSDKEPHGPLTSEVFYGIISVARAKARQQLDSLSSRYQNSLPLLAKNQQPQQGKKGKQKDQSNQHVLIETYANPVIDEPMNIDESADPNIAASQLNQEGNSGSTQSTPSTTTPISTSPPNVITQSEEINKKSKITRLILPNNVIHDTQKGQVRTIMIYDIPTAWSHDVILNKLKSWGQVLEISFKPQHKYQSVWTKMILRLIIDTEFVMRTWSQKLDDFSVRWYPGHWKLKDRKERERFQAKILIPPDSTDNDIKNYWNGMSFEDFVLKKLKTKSGTMITDKGQRYVIVYFESQKDLHAAMEISQPWKMTESHSLHIKRTKSDKDKKKNLKSPKGKKAEPKGSTSSIKSRDKSKKHTKTNDDTRSWLKLILNLLS